MTKVSGHWLDDSGTQQVMALLEEAGYAAHAVGGCVRNALLGAPVADVDISTDALPDAVMALARGAGLKAIPTGIDHGTVTVVAGGEPHEITTYRADVETDGRRAVIRFADSMKEDALRRDFTMNALYADRRGEVVDPLGDGLRDLRARRLRFIQDAETRIREDYLRILRFFRFFAWYGDPTDGFDAEALAAIAGNLDGLDVLSAERVGAELRRLLEAPDPLLALAAMERTGVLAHVMPGAVTRLFGPLLHHEETLGLGSNAMRRMAILGFFDGAALRLSKRDQQELLRFQRLMSSDAGIHEVAWREGERVALDVACLRAASLEMPLPIGLMESVGRAAAARFPVKPADLMPERQGPALGAALKMLEAQWIKSDFNLGKSDLIALLHKG